MKRLVFAASVLVTSATLCAADANRAEAELEKEDDAKIFEAGVDFDFLSAYVWRNAIQNDEMVMQPCVWGDFTMFDPFYAGFSFWQNYDLTDRRTDAFKRGLTENDYNVHVGVTAWQSEDEDYALGFELGHEWYDNLYVVDANGIPDTREIYLKATFDNPFANVYGQASWMYEDFGDYKQGVHYELGFNREYEIVDSVTIGVDWNVSFGTGHYLNYLYGGTRSGFDENGEREYEGSSAGFGGTTVKAYATWQITECFSFGGVIAYTGVLNGAYREALDEETGVDYWGADDSYQRDFVWGGLQAHLSF